jgi:Epoxide hydrolase N terminus
VNAFPQFVPESDRLDIHFIHIKSPHEHALPQIITHGRPGSLIEMAEQVRAAFRSLHASDAT